VSNLAHFETFFALGYCCPPYETTSKPNDYQGHWLRDMPVDWIP
jgi:hypothetical protein